MPGVLLAVRRVGALPRAVHGRARGAAVSIDYASDRAWRTWPAWTRPRRRSWSSSGEASPVELVDAAIARIEALNPRAQRGHPRALRRGAREAARASCPTGPFRGVPFLLKDLGAALAGQPLHLGMKLLKDADFRAPVDSYLAERFRAAGLVTIAQDEHARARDPADHRARRLRRQPQPLGHRPDHRRLERRLGRGGRLGDGARSPTPTTAAARSGSRPASAACSGSSPPASGSPRAR